MPRAKTTAAKAAASPDFRVGDCLGAVDLPALADSYQHAKPYPHIGIDGLFPPQVLREVVEEVAETLVPAEDEFYATVGKRRLSNMADLGPRTRALIEQLNSATFLEFLETLTGIPALIPDPHLEGGGVHEITRDGFLKIHSDFNWHRRLKLHRRLNLLLYLNEDWREEWGGAIELWDEKMTGRQRHYLPIFNRMVIFSTTDTSFHGHPEPLACPADVRRRSVALYYYTAERPASETRFGKSTMTNYQAREGDGFHRGSLKYWRHQATIRLPFLRKLLRGE